MTSISKKVFIDKLDDIVNEYNNASHSKTKMRSVDKKSNVYIDFIKGNNERDPKCKIGKIGSVRISKYKSIFAKDCTPYWSEEVFLIKKIKNIASWTYVVKNHKDEEIVGTFYQK